MSQWKVKFNNSLRRWVLVKDGEYTQIIPLLKKHHAEAAQRICDIYNEVLP